MCGCPAGTITWRRAFFEALSIAFELTYVRKARRQRGWRRGRMAARSVWSEPERQARENPRLALGLGAN
jgi:hypothetical protein